LGIHLIGLSGLLVSINKVCLSFILLGGIFLAIQQRSFNDTEEKLMRAKHELNYHILMVESARMEVERLEKMQKKDREHYDSIFNADANDFYK
tara:strand:+ start:420 stop:698 length:279 start_codon:yes stop_codon:yes gene_type:complete